MSQVPRTLRLNLGWFQSKVWLDRLRGGLSSKPEA